MKCAHSHVSRRQFLNTTARGVLGGLAALHLPRQLFAQTLASTSTSRAALTAGDSRADNIFSALKLIEGDIKKSLAGKKRVVIKPNLVLVNNQLSATHVECIEGILELFSTLHKDEFIVMDSPAAGSATAGYENYDYYRLDKKYKVKFLDLDLEPTVIRHVIDHRHMPLPVRMNKMLLDPDTYIVSSAVLKTHDRAVVTLSLKNVTVGAAMKDPTFAWGKKSGASDKWTIHGGRENAGINYNLFHLGKELHPHLAVLDGFAGMEHNGPCAGTPVDHRVAVASTDWLAADRIGTKLMGFDFDKVGYLTFAAQAGLGQADLARIDVLGQKIDDHIRQYKPADNIEKQYQWLTRGTEAEKS